MSRRSCIGIFIALGVLELALPSFSAAVPLARLTLSSQPGDYIGGGGEYDIVYDDAVGQVSPSIRRSLPDGSPAELLWVLFADLNPIQDFALVFFGTDQLGIPIQPGFYPDAQRADFADPGHPGLDISFQHRGCNTVTGSFTIGDATFAPDGAISSFDATFEQHCEGGAPALFGRFQFRASGLSVPEPSAALLLSLSLAGFGAALKRPGH